MVAIFDGHHHEYEHEHCGNCLKMMQLPNEILEEIFCRLSVRDLIRFRCVSKSWFALISSPYFVKLHMERSDQTKSNHSLYLPNDIHCREVFDFLKPVKVDYVPLKFRNYGLQPSGSCNGLLCMSKMNDIDNVFLWNPSTKKYIKLPYEPVDLPYRIDLFIWTCDYRIVYDSTNEDYKVVRFGVLQLGRRAIDVIDYEVKVYSLRLNLWHRLEKFDHYPNWKSIGDSIAGGALHWISKWKKVIVAFDIVTERYRILPHPEYHGSYDDLYLNNLGGCLSLSCHYKSSNVDVFLLKEYGGKNEHWSKLITLSQTISFEIYYPVKPIAYSYSDKQVVIALGDSRLILYNLEQKSVEETMIHGVVGRSLLELHICIESLVSVDVPICNHPRDA
ncbi:F-box protein CPR1-like [Impatiens glandulifera]|uniref:F-box protein CPR1-like n=1 Tax=Impatiens glandulifera TaxID=253017 RepID=UPI001FB15947|nr:F-box protein CPR1-like [Impatiens glandulifera]